MSYSGDSIAPFFAIWIAPRDTIRQIIDSDPRRHVIAIAALSGALSGLEGSWLGAMSEPHTMSALWPFLVALKVALFAVWAIVGLYLAGWTITAACRALGGVANSVQTRAAIAWASIPGIAATGLGVIGLLAGIVTPHALRPGAFSFPPELAGLSAILGIWGLVLEVKCIGEVNHFSAWRALAAQLLLLLVLVTIAVAAILVIHLNR
ncbi:MAG TPA: YIP1 family protein [Candidatus Binataceae bacterium]|nr:YIP1 family protein [Candidatus Binataceae bacterium]